MYSSFVRTYVQARSVIEARTSQYISRVTTDGIEVLDPTGRASPLDILPSQITVSVCVCVCVARGGGGEVCVCVRERVCVWECGRGIGRGRVCVCVCVLYLDIFAKAHFITIIRYADCLINKATCNSSYTASRCASFLYIYQSYFSYNCIEPTRFNNSYLIFVFSFLCYCLTVEYTGLFIRPR